MDNPPMNTNIQKRFTIGFLSEVATYETESQLFQGADEAAKSLNANLIYIAPLANDGEALHFTDRSDEETKLHIRRKQDRLIKHLNDYKLDGLLFLGWMPEFQGELGSVLRQKLQPIQLMSIGSLFEEIPSVFMDGGSYIEQLASHLIHDHGRKRIAYVSGWQEDNRLVNYRKAMREAELYNENLIVTPSDLLPASGIDNRMRLALTLLEERSMNIDAIMTMTAFEGKFMLDELQRRGIRVPEDIALVSYEDHPNIEFSNPSLTTIEFPCHELGQTACMNLLQLLNGQEAPYVEEVPARILYRDSCGCTINKIKPIRQLSIFGEAASDSFSPVSPDPVTIERILNDIHNFAIGSVVDIEGLARAFIDSLQTGKGTFLILLGLELKKLSTGNRRIPNWLTGFVEQLKDLFSPIVSSAPQLSDLAETLWFAASHVAKDLESASAVERYIKNHDHNHVIGVISEQLLSAHSMADVESTLNRYLGWVQIPSIFVFVPKQRELPSITPELKLAFAINSYQQYTWSGVTDSDQASMFHDFKQRREGRFNLVVMPMLIGEEQIGTVWVEPGEHSISLVVTLINLIGKAIKSANVLEESNNLVSMLRDEIVLRQEKEAQLAYYADIDSLTRLFNRRYFYQALASMANAGQEFTIFYIDIDGFKPVNDTYGHDAGDELLIQIAERLRNVLSGISFPLNYVAPIVGSTQSGSVFRLGGDEFTALLRTGSNSEAKRYAAQVVEAIRAPFILTETVVQVSTSIGIAMFPHDTYVTEQLTKYADLALYSAKKTKNNWAFYRDMANS